MSDCESAVDKMFGFFPSYKYPPHINNKKVIQTTWNKHFKIKLKWANPVKQYEIKWIIWPNSMSSPPVLNLKCTLGNFSDFFCFEHVLKVLLIKMLSVSGHSLDTEAKKNENVLNGSPSESTFWLNEQSAA